MQGDKEGEVQRRRPGDLDTYDETGRREDRSAPAPESQEDGGLFGERGREQGGGGGVGRVCLGPALYVGGNSGFFFFFSGKTASRSSWRPGERGRDGMEEG